MKLKFKQKLLTFLDKYDVFDENDNVIYAIQSKFTIGRILHIYDATGHIATIEKVLFSFPGKYKVIINGEFVGEIQKEFTFFKPKFYLNINGWTIEGDIFQWNYEILDGSKVVATISKELISFTDFYTIDVKNDDDALLVLLSVLAIDALKDDSNKKY